MSTRLGWLTAAFLLSLLAIGAGYWPVPYSRLDTGDLFGAGMFVAATAALLLRLFALAPTWMIVLALAAAAPAVALGRVLADWATDPTTHNLWPIELVLAAALGLVWVSLATLAGAGLARLVRGRTEPRP